MYGLGPKLVNFKLFVLNSNIIVHVRHLHGVVTYTNLTESWVPLGTTISENTRTVIYYIQITESESYINCCKSR